LGEPLEKPGFTELKIAVYGGSRNTEKFGGFVVGAAQKEA
jgi:hypothetical protein